MSLRVLSPYLLGNLEQAAYEHGPDHWHWCPGCNELHRIAIGTGPGPRWQWNGSVETPAYQPSVKHTWRNGEEQIHKCCHYFVEFDPNRDAMAWISYCSDSTHSLAGQRVLLPEIPPENVARHTE